MKHPRQQPSTAADSGDFSERLIARVREAIVDSGGALDFSEFMHRVLYEPGLGYYVTGHPKLGDQGDFVTAPELGALFGQCLARQCGEVLNRLEGGDVLEFGAGTGALCARVLESLADSGALPERYWILELSPELRERQRQTITRCCPDLLSRCRWLDHLPEAFEGIVIANEVLDAMPVERFRATETGLEIIQVTWGDAGFRETTRTAEPVELPGIRELHLPPGYESEVGMLGQQWVSGIADWLTRGVVLIVDYGFPAREYYHPERSGGTLMCHYRHHAHTNPYIHVGMQDITAHLDFSALAHRGDEAGLDILGFVHQGGFLISLGLLDIAEAAMAVSPEGRWTNSQQVQRLTQTHEMGELFKVLALGRGYPGELAGFRYLDHVVRL